MTRCRHCSTTWSGMKIAHCATCHQTFTTPANFDRHRRGGVCNDGATVGLVRNDRDQWAQPGRSGLPGQVDEP